MRHTRLLLICSLLLWISLLVIEFFKVCGSYVGVPYYCTILHRLSYWWTTLFSYILMKNIVLFILRKSNAEFAFFATLDIWMVHFWSSGIRLHYFELVVHVHLNYKITSFCFWCLRCFLGHWNVPPRRLLMLLDFWDLLLELHSLLTLFLCALSRQSSKDFIAFGRPLMWQRKSNGPRTVLFETLESTYFFWLFSINNYFHFPIRPSTSLNVVKTLIIQRNGLIENKC